MKLGFTILGLATCIAASGAIASDLPSKKSPVAPSGSITTSNSDAYVSLFSGKRWVAFEADGTNVDFDDSLIGGRFSGSHNFDQGFGIQADGTFFRNTTEIADLSEYDGALHAYLRLPSQGLIGLVGQVGQSELNINEFIPIPIGIDWQRSYFGAEGQFYQGNMTFYGQVAYEKTDLNEFLNTEIPDATGWVGTAQVRYFVNPDLRIDITGSYTNRNFGQPDGLVFGGDLEFDIWSVGLGAETKLASTPLSLFGNIDYVTSDLGSALVPDVTYTNTRILAGLKLNLGSQTLLQRDRSGASLDPLPHISQPLVDLIIADGLFVPE